jgi:tetratricopeptide (TPR) repeat protein
MKKELPDELRAQIVELCKAGDSLADHGDFDSAIQQYLEAFHLLPPPFSRWEAATWILTALGDAYFFKGEFEKARQVLSEAMHCPEAIGNPFLHLRLGQAQYELANEARAADELARALMGGGEDLFHDEDPKYLNWIQATLNSRPSL